MAHSRTWDNADPATSDNASAGAQEIREFKVDVDERQKLEHFWGSTGNTTIGGTHIPGKASVVENQSTDATIVANGGDFLAAFNGSVARASDTGVLYVKVGTEGLTNGTWTAIVAQTSFLDTSSGSDTSPYGDLVLDGGSIPMTSTFTDLDLSSTIGAQATLVFLKILNNEGVSKGGFFRPNGSTEDVGVSTVSEANGCTLWRCSAGKTAFVICSTDSSGIVEYAVSSTTPDIDVFLMNWIK